MKKQKTQPFELEYRRNEAVEALEPDFNSSAVWFRFGGRSLLVNPAALAESFGGYDFPESDRFFLPLPVFFGKTDSYSITAIRVRPKQGTVSWVLRGPDGTPVTLSFEYEEYIIKTCQAILSLYKDVQHHGHSDLYLWGFLRNGFGRKQAVYVLLMLLGTLSLAKLKIEDFFSRWHWDTFAFSHKENGLFEVALGSHEDVRSGECAKPFLFGFGGADKLRHDLEHFLFYNETTLSGVISAEITGDLRQSWREYTLSLFRHHESSIGDFMVVLVTSEGSGSHRSDEDKDFVYAGICREGDVLPALYEGAKKVYPRSFQSSLLEEYVNRLLMCDEPASVDGKEDTGDLSEGWRP